MSNNNAFKGGLATPSISDSPIVADSQATNEKWLAQQLLESGITNPVLVKQFKPHKAGFTVTGVDIAGKPNGNSWQLRLREEGKDGAKYKTRGRKAGEDCCYDALLFRGKLTDFPKVAERAKEHVSLDTNKGDLWQWIYCFPHLPIAITEGAKKAACGIENGYITLSIPGCTMGHKPGSNELVDTLGAVCEEGRPVTLLPDYDFRSNPAVYRAWLKLAKTIETAGCKVTIGCWELTDVPNHEKLTTENIKGMDDFIVNGGNFDEVIKAAMTIAQWEKQFAEPEPKEEGASSKKDKPKKNGGDDPTPVEFARQLAEENRNRWRFHNEQKT
ncbi:DUF3854 domain-containing protein [Roseofilum sp. Guam]|uniref:DUF3854 domain-containing protein n=1 Tax=Roseofilum sp. Guam TaxID=2821502 RepID=UPI001B194834|nr:DUF3854 domain-containing protein [Roseofilum sp. Guam]MBP0031520.1 DUF3854 domain-containing protein [Roseofilum sp. Guam]